MTLIAAWKTPGLPEAGNQIEGIRVISDSLLSHIAGPDTHSRWRKVHSVKPSLRVPMISFDEERWESFGGWTYEILRPVGVFFAGSSLAFNATFATFRDALETLGLKAKTSAEIRVNPSPYKSQVTYYSKADKYYPVQDICSALYYPVPPLDLAFVAECLAEELRGCYACLEGDLNDRQNRQNFKYHVEIGLVGYCRATTQFRIFHIFSKAVTDEEGFVNERPDVLVSESADDGILLLGSHQSHATIQAEIDRLLPIQPDQWSEMERLSLARQVVVECSILAGQINGVRGPLTRAEVSRDRGFEVTDNAWSPRERLWDLD